MARRGTPDLTCRVAARWLLSHELPPQSKLPFHLPVALVAHLSVGQNIRAIDGQVYVVTAVGPGALMLDNGREQLIFANHGYGSYSWAYYAAPHLHWVLND